MDKFPACFETVGQLAEWKKAARLSYFTKADGYCADCLPEYKDRMLWEGRCGFPGVVFVNRDGEIVGRRSEAEIRAVKNRKKGLWT